MNRPSWFFLPGAKRNVVNEDIKGHNVIVISAWVAEVHPRSFGACVRPSRRKGQDVACYDIE